MSLVGNLEDLGLGEILQIVSLSRKTGVLSLHSRGREGKIVFRLGQVVRATSTSFQQSLGEILIQKGVIDLAILRKALALQQENGFRERLGVILIHRFGVAQEVVEEVVCGQIENVVFSLFAWAEGDFEFEVRDDIETVDGTKMDPLQFMLDQGLNPQFLAMEGTRILDEQRYSEEAATVGEHTTEVDFGFHLVDESVAAAPVSTVERQPVVVVDDDGPTLQAIADGLRDAGFDVHAMTRSEDTLIKVDTLFRSGASPTILVDLIMPKMDGQGVLGGVELLELLHNNFKDLPIVVMSDYHHADAETTVGDLGYPFIMKPRRAEINNTEMFQDFLSMLLPAIHRSETGPTEPVWHHRFNLGDELRLEMGEDGETAALAKADDVPQLGGVLEELDNLDSQGSILLLILRFTAEFMNRAVVFSFENGMISGIGQFGIAESSGRGGDEVVRRIRFSLDASTMFRETYRTARAMVFKPQTMAEEAFIFEQLGGGVPGEIFVAPIIGNTRIIGFLCGDNLPENSPLGETDPLEVFLSHAGLAMEKNSVARYSHERSIQ